MIPRFTWIGALLISATIRTFAYPPDYGPFAAGAAPTNSCVKIWPCIAQHGLQWTFAPASNAVARISVGQQESRIGEYTVRITDDHGMQVLPETEIDGGYSAWGVKVYSGFINEDKRPDYVVVTGGTGMGILGWHQIIVFILSEKGSYRVVPIESWKADPSTDLVDLKGDGRCEFIQTSFIEWVEDKHGRGHNYWAHNLLRFEGAQCVPANQLDSRFPCWVRYTSEPNHRDARQVPKRRRPAIWLEKGQGEMQYPQFPHRALANDQTR
jgi:hypothetical protein